MTRTHVSLRTTAAAITMLLAACGGGTMPSDTPTAAQTPTATAAAADATPADRGAHTRQGRYLTADQARELAHRVGDRLVAIEARCCGPETAEQDALIAFGVQAAADLPNDAPFVVSGGDLRQAAAVADRLSEMGALQVHLVTR